MPIRSHAYVERIEDGGIFLEVRLTPTDFVPPSEEHPKKRFRYPRKKVQLPIEEVAKVIPGVKARDVLVVEHTDGEIHKVCYLDTEETKMRFERAAARRRELKKRMQQRKKT